MLLLVVTSHLMLIAPFILDINSYIFINFIETLNRKPFFFFLDIKSTAFCGEDSSSVGHRSAFLKDGTQEILCHSICVQI